MNKHILFDKLTASIASATLGRSRFFSESLESESFIDNIQATFLKVPELEHGIFEVDAMSKAGRLDPAYYVCQWKGNDYPTIIYHHGNNERPFEFSRFAKNSFKTIFIDTKEPVDANLIVVRAPFHNSTLKEYQNKVKHLSNFVAMLTASVKLIEAVISELRKNSDGRIIVSGISLGGWVTNLHRSFYNMADVYVPLLAGAALDHVFTDSAYRKMGGKLAHKNPQIIKNTLNFENEFKKIRDDNVFPLLGKYDQFIQYDRQRDSYPHNDVKSLNTGHVTSFLAGSNLRKHILSVMQ